jgi:sRNA-binding carbon storage regulator CsrA
MGLVVTRKPGESIVVNGPAEFKFVRGKGRQILVEVIAAADVNIRRAELPEKKEPRK